MPDSAIPNVMALAHEDHRRTAHRFVYDALRRAILGGTLPAGTRLVQADIANQLTVSTTPVREALRELAADGLIRFDPHRGAMVRELDPAEVTEIYELRELLEPLGVKRAAERITDAELQAASDLQDTMDAATDPAVWVELNWQFHRLIDAASGSPRLTAIVSSLQDAAALCVAASIKVQPDRMAAGNHDHRQLLEALRARDPDRAAEILALHLKETRTAFEEQGAPEPG